VQARKKETNCQKKTGKSKMMSIWLIAGVGVCYGLVAFEQAIKGNFSLSVVWGGYCFSQWGLLWITMHGGK
jgi:hypothetical protein